jgi:hypothetical protein
MMQILLENAMNKAGDRYMGAFSMMNKRGKTGGELEQLSPVK